MSEEKFTVYLITDDTALLSLSVPKEFAVKIDKLSKETGIPKNRLIVELVEYAIKKILEEEKPNETEVKKE